jgi:hypothetical protein
MTKHATLSASSAHRWIACPGSVRLCTGLSSPLTEYAERGTANHKLAEWCIPQTPKANWLPAESKVGKTVMKSRLNGEFIVVRPDDAAAVQVYLDTISADVVATPSSTLTVEKRFDLSWLYPGLYGTNDAMLAQPYGILRVYDYKNGSGVAVDAEGNPQAMYYALGALGKENIEAVEQVEIIIVQPNGQGEKVKRWMTTPEALYSWANEVLLPAAKATEEPKAPLHDGPHCKFCPAFATCPQVRKTAFDAAGLAFSEVLPDTVELPAVALMPVEQLGRLAEIGADLRKWFSAIDETLHNHLLQGHNVPGWKLVEGRANRKWLDEAVVAATLKPVYGESIYEPRSLRSVSQMEKAMKLAGGDTGILEPLVAVSRSPQIAKESDKRPAINSAAVFTEIGESEEFVD